MLNSDISRNCRRSSDSDGSVCSCRTVNWWWGGYAVGALALGLALSSPDGNRTNLNASAIFAQQHALDLPAKHAHVEPFYSPMAMHRFAALVAHAQAIARVAYPGWLESALRTHQHVRSASAPVTAGGRTSVIADEPLHTGVAGRDEPLRGLHAGSLIQPRRDVLFKCVAKRLGPAGESPPSRRPF